MFTPSCLKSKPIMHIFCVDVKSADGFVNLKVVCKVSQLIIRCLVAAMSNEPTEACELKQWEKTSAPKHWEE